MKAFRQVVTASGPRRIDFTSRHWCDTMMIVRVLQTLLQISPALRVEFNICVLGMPSSDQIDVRNQAQAAVKNENA